MLPAEKLTDKDTREAWCSPVPAAALQVNLRGWTPKKDKPLPPWSLLEKARLYHDPKYAAHLEQLSTVVFRPVLNEASTRHVRTYDIGPRKMRLFKQEEAIPGGVTNIPVRLALVHATDLRELSPVVNNCLVKGSLVAVWGHGVDVLHAVRAVGTLGVAVRQATVRMYQKHGGVAPSQASATGTSREMECSELMLQVIGHNHRFTETVCFPTTLPCWIG